MSVDAVDVACVVKQAVVRQKDGHESLTASWPAIYEGA